MSDTTTMRRPDWLWRILDAPFVPLLRWHSQRKWSTPTERSMALADCALLLMKHAAAAQKGGYHHDSRELAIISSELLKAGRSGMAPFADE